MQPRSTRKGIGAGPLVCLACLALALWSPSALAADQCHGSDPRQHFYVDRASLVACLKSGGVSGRTLDADELAYAIRAVTGAIRLEDVIIDGSFSSSRTAFTGHPPATPHQCAAVVETSRRSACTSAVALQNDLEFRRVKVAGVLNFSETTFLRGVTLEKVEATEFNFDRSYFLGPVDLDGISTLKGISFIGSAVTAGMSLNRSTSANIWFDGGEVSGGLRSEDSDVEKMTMRGITFRGEVAFRRLWVRESAWIYESTFGGDLHIVESKAGSVEKDVRFAVVRSEVTRAFNLSGTQVHGAFRTEERLYQRANKSNFLATRLCLGNAECAF